MPMKRLGVLVSAAFLACCGAATAAVPPRAELRGLVCRHAAAAPGRMVSVTAVMRPVTGTVRMAVKFELARRSGGMYGFRPLSGRQLNQWIYPANPTLGQNPADVWMLKQNVVNLAAPASYRFQVWFRWTGADGRVLARTVEVSPACYEPDPRPDLAVRWVTVEPLSSGQTEYDVTIGNLGGSGSGPFGVTLEPPGGPAQTVDSQSLAAGADEREVFDGPACTPDAQVTAVADPDDQVNDSNRANNTLTVDCPAGP